MRVTSSPVIESRMMRLLGNTASALIGVDQAEMLQHPERIGPELNAGADFLELGRLFDDLRRDALALQRQSGGQPADAAADDQDLFVLPIIIHCAFPLAGHSRAAARAVILR